MKNTRTLLAVLAVALTAVFTVFLLAGPESVHARRSASTVRAQNPPTIQSGAWSLAEPLYKLEDAFLQ